MKKYFLITLLIAFISSNMFATYSDPSIGVDQLDWWKASIHKGSRQDPIPVRDGYGTVTYNNGIWQIGVAGVLRGLTSETFNELSSGYGNNTFQATKPPANQEWAFAWVNCKLIKNLEDTDSEHDLLSILDFKIINKRLKKREINPFYYMSRTEELKGACYEGGEMEGFVTCSIVQKEPAYLVIGDLWFYIDSKTTIDFGEGEPMSNL